MDSALRCQEVNKNYGSLRALANVSLEIAAGEFFGLVGVNGAGKTTLLKCLLDFCAIDSGKIEIFSCPHYLSKSRQRIAFLPERFNPPYFLTGEGFIRHVLTLQSVVYSRANAEQMLYGLDLDLKALNTPVRTYSKGMTQKLGLAACFLAQKDLYILDEPTSGLDPKARALFKTCLRELKTHGRSLFFTSHALADVAEVCDRMAIVHDGVIRYIGTPAELCQHCNSSTLEQAFLHIVNTKQDNSPA